jgi:hypothetical protein
MTDNGITTNFLVEALSIINSHNHSLEASIIEISTTFNNFGLNTKVNMQ